MIRIPSSPKLLIRWTWRRSLSGVCNTDFITVRARRESEKCVCAAEEIVGLIGSKLIKSINQIILRTKMEELDMFGASGLPS